MEGTTGVLIKIGVRMVLFGIVFFVAARRNPKVHIHARWGAPVVAVVFAVLNTGLYWALTPVLNLATFGALGFFMPFIVNMILLIATVKFFAWHRMPRVVPRSDKSGAKPVDAKVAPRPLFEIGGALTTLWMAAVLTAAHGALWVALDYLPSR